MRETSRCCCGRQSSSARADQARISPTEVIATDHWLDRQSVLVDELPRGTPIRRVTDEVLRPLSTVNPDGVACLALSCLPPVKPNFTRPGSNSGSRQPGTLLRTALAADVEAVWLGAGADPESQGAGASAGTLFQLAHQRFGPMVRRLFITWSGRRSCLTRVSGGGHWPRRRKFLQPLPYWELDWTRPTALVPALRALASTLDSRPVAPMP